jgi:hypothetical protein
MPNKESQLSLVPNSNDVTLCVVIDRRNCLISLSKVGLADIWWGPCIAIIRSPIPTGCFPSGKPGIPPKRSIPLSLLEHCQRRLFRTQDLLKTQCLNIISQVVRYQ